MYNQLVYVPDLRLRKISNPVENVNQNIVNMLNTMQEVMIKGGGIGLAGVQVGFMYRVIVVKVEDSVIHKMINPKILDQSIEEDDYEEGCLSIPTITVLVKRPKDVLIDYIDEHGNSQNLHVDNLLARCIQHEIDHLNGILITDRLSKLKREYVYRQVKKHLKEENKQEQ